MRKSTWTQPESRIFRVSVHSWKIMDTKPRGAECHYFSGMDRYSDFLLLKIHLNIQLCIMTSLHRLIWIIYSWCSAKILKFCFFVNSITLSEAHTNINYTLHSGFNCARQTVHYFCVFWYTCSYINAVHASNRIWVPVHRDVHTRFWNNVIYNVKSEYLNNHSVKMDLYILRE